MGKEGEKSKKGGIIVHARRLEHHTGGSFLPLDVYAKPEITPFKARRQLERIAKNSVPN